MRFGWSLKPKGRCSLSRRRADARTDGGSALCLKGDEGRLGLAAGPRAARCLPASSLKWRLTKLSLPNAHLHLPLLRAKPSTLALAPSPGPAGKAPDERGRLSTREHNGPDCSHSARHRLGYARFEALYGKDSNICVTLHGSRQSTSTANTESNQLKSHPNHQHQSIYRPAARRRP